MNRIVDHTVHPWPSRSWSSTLPLTALQARERLPEHKTEGRISIHVLSGHIQVKASGRTFSLRDGGLLALDRAMPHEVEALEESAFLLTIAWPGAHASSADTRGDV